MKEPKDLQPGDKCYIISKDLSVKIVEVAKRTTNGGTWIDFKEPIPSVFCTPDVKEFTRTSYTKTVFFDKERTLTYMRNKIKRINKDIEKIEKT